MKLLKTTEQKHWKSSTGKESSATFGLFECPYCGNTRELALSKGHNQKSCGTIECKKHAHSDGYNRSLSANNLGNIKDNRTKHKYYVSFKSMFYTNKELLKENNIHGFDEFYELLFNTYCDARKKISLPKLKIEKNNIILISSKSESNIEDKILNTDKTLSELNNEILNINENRKQSLLIGNKTIEDNIIDILENNKYNTLYLSRELDTKHNLVIKAIKSSINRNDNEMKDYKFKSLCTTRQSEIYSLTIEQYKYMHLIIRAKKQTKSTGVYIIKASTGEYKIGITHNMDKRMSNFIGQTPPSITYEVIFFKDIGVVAQKVESILHEKLKKHNMHIQYEWFNLNEATIEQIKYSIINHNEFVKKYENNMLIKNEKEINEKNKKWIEDKLISLNKKYYEITKKREKLLIQQKKVDIEFTKSIKIRKNIEIEKEKIRNKNIISTNEPRKRYVDQNIKHGMAGTKVYQLWQSMKTRAKKNDIKIEPEWVESFDIWMSDIEDMYDVCKEMLMIEKAKGYIRGNIEFLSHSEARTKIRAKKISKIDKVTGLVLFEYSGAKEASLETEGASAGHITACASGKRKSHAGFYWKYA